MKKNYPYLSYNNLHLEEDSVAIVNLSFGCQKTRKIMDSASKGAEFFCDDDE